MPIHDPIRSSRAGGGSAGVTCPPVSQSVLRGAWHVSEGPGARAFSTLRNRREAGARGEGKLLGRRDRVTQAVSGTVATSMGPCCPHHAVLRADLGSPWLRTAPATFSARGRAPEVGWCPPHPTGVLCWSSWGPAVGTWLSLTGQRPWGHALATGSLAHRSRTGAPPGPA